MMNTTTLFTESNTTQSEDGDDETKLTRTEYINMEKSRLKMGARKKDYSFYEVIGKGSYGVVYRAKSNHTKHTVAIKVLDKNMIKGNGMLHHVKSEVIIHLKMKHENIVELYHFFEDSTSIYMVMEYCKYNMLYYLKEKGKLSERRCRKYMRDIISGLMHLHASHVLHRDLKLANLLISENKRVKISDFGLSRYASPGEECGTQLGTPKYMAYEVVLQQPYSQKADNWSLGCILFALLAGYTPFHRDVETVEETFKLIQKMEYQIPSFFSKEAADLVQQLLQRDPKKRYSLAQVLGHEFFTGYPNHRLNSQHLKPISHTTKLGQVLQITESRQVYIQNENIVVIISPDGKHIWYSECRDHFDEYSYRTMPDWLREYYEYAASFVNLVKAKTPKIVHQTTIGKCLLMQNEPLPDVEMLFFSDGMRLVYARNVKQISVYNIQGEKSQISLTKDLLAYSDRELQKMDQKLSDHLISLKENLEQCLYKSGSLQSSCDTTTTSTTTSSSATSSSRTLLNETIDSAIVNSLLSSSTDHTIRDT